MGNNIKFGQIVISQSTKRASISEEKRKEIESRFLILKEDK